MGSKSSSLTSAAGRLWGMKGWAAGGLPRWNPGTAPILCQWWRGWGSAQGCRGMQRIEVKVYFGWLRSHRTVRGKQGEVRGCFGTLVAWSPLWKMPYLLIVLRRGEWCSLGFSVHPCGESKLFSDAIVASGTSGCTGKDTDKFYIPHLFMLWCGQVDKLLGI